MTRICLVLGIALVTSVASAGDTTWINYHNGYLGFFAIYGPERMTLFDPSDFGLRYPFQIESLYTRFYSGMGSWRDSVFVIKAYSGDGQRLLFASESLIAPRTLEYKYQLSSPVVIDSGDFYAGVAVRYESLGFAYPFLTTDDNTSATHSWFGIPGNWQAWSTGEYFLAVFVRYVGVGKEEGSWFPARSSRLPAGIVRGRLNPQLPIPNCQSVWLLDAAGRKVMDLHPGENDVSGLAPGVYFVREQPAFSNRCAAIRRVTVTK